MKKLFIDDMPDSFFKGKNVLVRVDYNVPILRGQIKEDYRIRQTIATIEHLSKRGAKVILISHLGRPGGIIDSKLSLKPVADKLLEVVNVSNIKFVDECTGTKVRNVVNHLQEGGVLLLENLRFYKGEQENDPGFCKFFAQFADIYVNDAFSSSHRKHSSIYGIPKLIKQKIGGFVLKNEINNLDKIVNNPQKPFLVIVGGRKVLEKIRSINSLVKLADKIIIGGCVAQTFLAAKGVPVGDSIVVNKCLNQAKEIIKNHEDKIILPSDFLVKCSECYDKFKNVDNEMSLGQRAMDIGRNTTARFTHEMLNNNGTIFWCGPMGQYELDEFAIGTNEIVKALLQAQWRGADTLVGGGDTIAAIRKADISLDEFDFVSTGGSATLEYLSGASLPGIEILSKGLAPKKTVININYEGEAVCL